MEMILNLIGWILSIAGFIGVVGLVPFGIAGIVLLVMQTNEKELIKKELCKKKGIFFLVLPWMLIIGSLIFIVIVNFAKAMLLTN